MTRLLPNCPRLTTATPDGRRRLLLLEPEPACVFNGHRQLEPAGLGLLLLHVAPDGGGWFRAGAEPGAAAVRSHSAWWTARRTIAAVASSRCRPSGSGRAGSVVGWVLLAGGASRLVRCRAGRRRDPLTQGPPTVISIRILARPRVVSGLTLPETTRTAWTRKPRSSAPLTRCCERSLALCL